MTSHGPADPAVPAPPLAVIVDDNLMSDLPLQAGLRGLGFQVRSHAGRGDAAAEIAQWGPALVIVNMGLRASQPEGVIRSLRERLGSAVRIVGFAGHVEEERLLAAREAGADLAAPNSAMRGSLAAVLARLDAA